MKCCLNTLGIYPHNLPINTGILATQPGDHLLYMKAANGNTFILKKKMTLGTEFVFPVGELNESMAYDFRIEQPDGSFKILNECENFNLKTTINTQKDDCIDNCKDDSDSSNYYGY